MTWTVTAFYKFVTIDDPVAFRPAVREVCAKNGIVGTVLLAAEGINGTVAGPADGIAAFLAFLRADARFADLVSKDSYAVAQPFQRMKVRLKREIVTLGRPEADPNKLVGAYIEPKDWNALIARDDVILVDTRNDYEVKIGTFEGAMDPKTRSFREFPAYVREHLDPARHKRVAMFCTGGIRCEKSTALLRMRGFDEVYHLQGGILKYLETVAPQDSLWQGQCFVFDERVSVGHSLVQGDLHLCRSCRRPLEPHDLASPLYEEGVSCAHCHASLDVGRRRGLVERQRQVTLARQRGTTHIAAEMPVHPHNTATVGGS